MESDSTDVAPVIDGREKVCPACGTPPRGAAVCATCGRWVGYTLIARSAWDKEHESWNAQRAMRGILVDLPPAKILHVDGWGKTTPTRGDFRLALVREAEGKVQINRDFDDRTAYAFSPTTLAISVKNGAVRSGGGFIGGGFGPEGAALGMLGGALLNALTTRNKHYGMLTLAGIQQGISTRLVVLGYQNLTDSEIAAIVATALPSFMDYWIDGLLKRLEEADDAKRAATRPGIELMATRGMLTAEQLKRVKPAIGAPSEEREHTVIEKPAQPDLPPPRDTAAQLKELAELHASGSLTDVEFAAAKAKLLF